ncbi:MAG: hypothetical protein M1831_005823 [Alyxoria varia]|nr:MAG: hypothetical protein M1831_005823 [Alyxoria varia]
MPLPFNLRKTTSLIFLFYHSITLTTAQSPSSTAQLLTDALTATTSTLDLCESLVSANAPVDRQDDFNTLASTYLRDGEISRVRSADFSFRYLNNESVIATPSCEAVDGVFQEYLTALTSQSTCFQSLACTPLLQEGADPTTGVDNNDDLRFLLVYLGTSVLPTFHDDYLTACPIDPPPPPAVPSYLSSPSTPSTSTTTIPISSLSTPTTPSTPTTSLPPSYTKTTVPGKRNNDSNSKRNDRRNDKDLVGSAGRKEKMKRGGRLENLGIKGRGVGMGMRMGKRQISEVPGYVEAVAENAEAVGALEDGVCG